MRKFSRHTTLTIAVTLISFGLLTDTSSAERFYQGRAYLRKLQRNWWDIHCREFGGL